MKLSTKNERAKAEEIAKFYKFEQNQMIARNAAIEMADFKNKQMEQRMQIVFQCLKDNTILSAAALQAIKRKILLSINDIEEGRKP